MRRLVRPLVYILGFSVFSACTTTKTVSQSDLRPSEDAIIDSDNLKGLIAHEDALTFSRYLVSNGSAERMVGTPVVIPLSDIVEVQFESPSKALSMALGFFAVVAFAGFLIFTGGDCSGLC